MTGVRILLSAALITVLLVVPVAARQQDPLPPETQEDGLPSQTQEDGLPQGNPGDDGLPQGNPGDDGLPRTGGGNDCVCPKAGVWEVTNLEGWIDCSKPVSFKRKLKGKDKNRGTIWLLDEDCSRWFGETHERKERDDVHMERLEGEGCGYFAKAYAEEEGMKVILEGSAVFQGDEFMTGEYSFYPEGESMKCEGYRPYEMRWIEPIPADRGPKLRKAMEKKLAVFMETYYLPPEPEGE